MDVARSAIRLGAKTVKIAYRRRKADMTALAEEVEGAVADGCEIMELNAPTRIEKTDDGKVAALWVQPQIVGEVKWGRPAPVNADAPEVRIACDKVLVAIGQSIEFGDVDHRFSIQSICKVVSLATALQHKGFDEVFSHVMMEPSGDAFNSILKLDTASNRPFNPMINAGAIEIVNLLAPDFTFEELLDFTRAICMDDDIVLNEAVYHSEFNTGDRNRAIGYLLESKSIIETDVEDALRFYTRMCSLDVTAESLANFANRLANDGVGNLSGKRYLSSETVRIVKTLMLTCGMYDGSGTYAVEVGIPTKSGVGGGLLAVSDKRAGIGVFGPSLDSKGNSIAGCRLLKEIANKLRLTLFFDTDLLHASRKKYSLNDFPKHIPNLPR